MSERESVGLPRTCSGDMYPAVPITVPASVPTCCVGASPERSASGRVSLARPKSRIFIASVAGNENVFRLQVAMDDALFVRGGQTTGNLLSVVDGLAGRESAVAQAVPQCLAFQQFRDDVGRAAVFANVEDGKNVGMVQRCRRAGFLRETLQALGIGGKRCWENLDGDIAVQATVASAVDFAHPTGADWRLNFIRAEFRARGQRHAWARL